MANPATEMDAGPPVTLQEVDPTIPRRSTIWGTCLGPCWRLKNKQTVEKVYVVGCMLALLVCLGLTLYKLSTVSNKDADFTFAWVLIINTVFCMIYTFHGVLQDRFTQLLALCVAMMVVFIYLIVNYITGKRDTIKLARLIIAVIVCPLVVIMGLYLSHKYFTTKELIIRHTGSADQRLQNMCQLYFTVVDLLIFDFQLSISMVVFVMTSRKRFNTEDMAVLSVGIPFTICWSLLYYFSMRREMKWGAIVAFVLYPVQIIYVIWKLVETARYETTAFPGLANSIFACAAVAFVIRAILIVVGSFVFRNFGKGVKENLFPDQTTRAQGGQPQPDQTTQAQGGQPQAPATNAV